MLLVIIIINSQWCHPTKQLRQLLMQVDTYDGFLPFYYLPFNESKMRTKVQLQQKCNLNLPTTHSKTFFFHYTHCHLKRKEIDIELYLH